ncbi:MAG TPA: glycosyltransferase [Caulobacteraceae bacterium]|nr:glycosyltransferase [Caulobacteraceae bacterium]
MRAALLDLKPKAALAARADRTARPLKVLHVLDNLGMGGAETWLMALLKHWREQGPDAPQVEILATGGKPSVYDEEAISLGARIHYVPYTRSTALSFAGAFRRILRQGRFAAMHDHQHFISGWHFLIGLGALPPVRITQVHNRLAYLEVNYLTTPARRTVAKIGSGLISRLGTFVGGTSEQSLREYDFARLHDPRGAVPSGALYCGLDPMQFAGGRAEAHAGVREEFGWPANAKIVLTVGRIDEFAEFDHPLNQKNSAFAVAVGIELARRDPDIRVLLAGDASAVTEALQRRVCSAGVANRIAFAGRRRDVGRLMKASDALLFPSRTEGLGMVAVEAQAAGLPVLASTAVPRECVVIPDAVRFLGLDEGVSAWVEHLRSLLASPRPDPIAASGLIACSPFSIEHSAAALVQLYRGDARQPQLQDFSSVVRAHADLAKMVTS